MIVIRNVFQIHPDRMKDATALVAELRAVNQRLGLPAGRAMTDLTGPFYTLVLEIELPSLAAWEESTARVFGNPEWQKAYGRFRPLIESGHRELFTVLE